MKSNLKDFLLVLFALVGLYLLFEISQNGRYEFSSDGLIVGDTRNGKVYIPGEQNKDGVYIWKQVYKEVK